MDKMDRILAAATDEFAEGGFGGARMDRIAERGEVNKATIYYHLGNKEELYAEVFQSKMVNVKDKLEKIYNKEQPAEEKLRNVIKTISSVPEKHPRLPRIMMREVASNMENLPKEVKEIFRDFIEIIRKILEEGKQEENFRDLSPVLTLVTLMGGNCFTMVGADQFNKIIEKNTQQPEFKVRDKQKHLVDLFLKGIITD